MDSSAAMSLLYAHFTADTQRYVKNLIDYFESSKDQEDSQMTYLFVSYLFPYVPSINLGLMSNLSILCNSLTGKISQLRDWPQSSFFCSKNMGIFACY